MFFSKFPWYKGEGSFRAGPDELPSRRPHRCPVCEGTGLVSKPPHIAGDQQTWTDSQPRPYPCQACGGSGIVWG